MARRFALFGLEIPRTRSLGVWDQLKHPGRKAVSGRETFGSPAELVAIASAAYRAGDNRLRRSAMRELRERFGIRITFMAEPRRVSA